MVESRTEITVSRHFLSWLNDHHLSLAFTTYQTNRLYLVGQNAEGGLSAFERIFDRPMGLYATPDRLYMSTRTQIWQMENALPAGQQYNGYDRLYTPRISHTTGDLDTHDVAPDGHGRTVFISTLYSCLAALSDRYSFEPIWTPPFISQLTPEDRCHLNGLALEDGQPRYVTTVSRSDVAAGWRARRESGGCIFDISTNELVTDSLSMPHSPRLYQGELYVLNSGMGEFGKVDRATGVFQPIAFLPGYLRGLAFWGDFAVIGLSKSRRERAFQGLPLQERLEQKDAEARCGLYVVNIHTGVVASWMEIEGEVIELYDVAVLPGVRRPMALGFLTDEINRLVTFPTPEGQRLDALDPEPEAQQPAPTKPSLPNVPQGVHPAKRKAEQPRLAAHGYRFTASLNLTAAAVLQSFEALTYPPLRAEMQKQPLQNPLIAVLAQSGEQPVGLALVEVRQDNRGAALRSLFVQSGHRQKGLASTMLTRLSKLLQKKGYDYLDWTYRSDWPALPVIERLHQHMGWLPAQTRLYQYRVDGAAVLQSPAIQEATLPDGFHLFPWAQVSANERQAIQAQAQAGVFPAALYPFYQEENMDLRTSFGLRWQGQVVGWLIGYRGQPDAVQYGSLYISQAAQEGNRRRAKLALPLMSAALQGQRAAGIVKSVFQIPTENAAMQKFYQEFLAAYQLRSSEVRITRLPLKKELTQV